MINRHTNRWKQSVTDLVTFIEDIGGDLEQIRLAAKAESGSEYPLAQAIIRKPKENGIPISNPDSFESNARLWTQQYIQII